MKKLKKHIKSFFCDYWLVFVFWAVVVTIACVFG